jgi:hypothetical protein
MHGIRLGTKVVLPSPFPLFWLLPISELPPLILPYCVHLISGAGSCVSASLSLYHSPSSKSIVCVCLSLTLTVSCSQLLSLPSCPLPEYILALPPIPPPCYDAAAAAAAVRRGQSICQRQAPPTSTTSLPLLAIIWRLAQGPETAACTALRLRVCSSMPAPAEDHLVPCPGCDNLQRSHTLQRRWTALQVELTSGRFCTRPSRFSNTS